jgi:FKBP-type peptidyl-prolyl cis-trans isomerase
VTIMRRGTRTLAVVVPAVLALGLVAGACGDTSKSTTTTTEASSGPSGPSTTAAPNTPEAKAVAARGEPKVTAVTGPVTELKVTDDVVGTGKEVKAGDTVTAQYVGAVAADGKVFQSSWQMNGAIQFPLDGVIQGWSEGLVGMKEGGRRTLAIPAAKAYGANPPPGSGIPANADLVFVVDLVSIA